MVQSPWRFRGPGRQHTVGWFIDTGIVSMQQIQDNATPPSFALFELGFRLFFKCSGRVRDRGHRIVDGDVRVSLPLAPRGSSGLWHGHEMVFGYAMAVIAGFRLQLSGIDRVLGLARYASAGTVDGLGGGARRILLAERVSARCSLRLQTRFYTPAASLGGTAHRPSQAGESNWASLLLVLLVVSNLVFTPVRWGTRRTPHFGAFIRGSIWCLRSCWRWRDVCPVLYRARRRRALSRRANGLGWMLAAWGCFWFGLCSTCSSIRQLLSVSYRLYSSCSTRCGYETGLRWASCERRCCGLCIWATGSLVLGFLLKALAAVSGIPGTLALARLAFAGIGTITLGMMSRSVLAIREGTCFDPPNVLAVMAGVARGSLWFASSCRL